MKSQGHPARDALFASVDSAFMLWFVGRSGRLMDEPKKSPPRRKEHALETEVIWAVIGLYIFIAGVLLLIHHLQPRDRELLVETARQSVAVMRSLWDASEAKAREAVFAAGVEHNEADLAAFARASQPLLSEYRKDPAIDALYRRIRDLA